MHAFVEIYLFLFFYGPKIMDKYNNLEVGR